MTAHTNSAAIDRSTVDAPDTAHDAREAARLTGSIVGSGQRVSTYAPVTGALLATFPLSTADDVAAAFCTARAAQHTWADTSPRERAKPFLRLHDAVLANTELIDLVQAETGKSRSSAFEETVDVAGLALYYGRHAPRFLAPRKRAGAIPIATRTRELRQPKGVVGIITPWNYPLSLSFGDIIPALLAGNAVVQKPDTQTPLTVLRAREVLIDFGLDPGLWQIVVGEPDIIGPSFIDAADHICFTGSTAAGRKVAEAAARRLIGCTLELGGKNPMLILDDADVDNAVVGTARSCFSTAGQLCLSTERLYVAADVYDEFVGKLVQRTRDLTMGKGSGFDYEIGSLTSQRQLETVVRHVSDARDRGATILTGGRVRPDLGPYFYEPTILESVTPEMEVFATETFGPVVSVYKVTSEDEAIGMANDSDYGLNASVWTSDTARGRRVAERIRCGAVNINEGYASAYASNDAPMGGMKASGQGRRHGETGIVEFTELQTVADQRLIRFDPPPRVTAEQNAKIVTQIYRLMKALHIK